MQFSFCTGPCQLYSWCWEWAQTHLSEIWKAMNYKTFLTLRASVKAPELLRCQDRCYYYWHNALNASYRQAKHFHMLNVTLWGTQYFLHLKQLSRNLPWSVYSHPDINGRGGIQTKAVDLNFSALGTGFLEDNFSFRAGSWMASGWFRCIAFLMHFQFSSVAQSCPAPLQPHGLQHARPPCPSPTPGACSNSCPLSRWCHPTISSSVIPLSSCLQSFPASESSDVSVLHIRWPKYWSFSFKISPSNEYSGPISFRIDWLAFLAVQGTQESFPTPQFKSINSSALSFLYSPTLTSIHDTGKTIALARWTFVGKIMSAV